MNGCSGVFTLPNTNSYTYSYKMWKDNIVANTKFTMKISSIPIIGIDIGTKLGAVAIGIGSCIGVGVGAVETVLHIIIETILIGVGISIGIGIVVGQCKYTIRTHFSNPV